MGSGLGCHRFQQQHDDTAQPTGICLVRTRAIRANEGPQWPLVRLRSIGLSLLLGVALTVSACAVGGPSAMRPGATATPSGPTPTPTPGTQLTMRAAWGNIPIASLPTDMGNKQIFVWEDAATPDNQWLLGSVEPLSLIGDPTLISYLALYNIHTRQIQRIHALLTPQSQVLGASVDDHWIAWSEADDPAYFDWTLFLYNRDTGQTTEVASAPKVNGQAVTGPNTPPVISHGHMIWSQPIGPVKQGDSASLQNAVVKLEDLSTGKITTLATSAGLSTMSWPWAAWGRYSPNSSDSGYYMEIKNLQNGQDIYFPQQPTTLVLDGVSVAYDNNYAGFLVKDITKYDNNPQQIATSQDVEWMTLNDRLAAWKQDTTQPIVWDRLFNRPIVLPEQNTADSTEGWVVGNLLVWWKYQDTVHETPTVLQIVDTSTLPTTPVSPS